jgi:tRNA pseudouridine38-40 synthase
MVRLVVGTLLAVGRGKITPAGFKAILLAQSRIDAGSAAPAAGLFLSRVEYPEGLVPEEAAPVGMPYFAGRAR